MGQLLSLQRQTDFATSSVLRAQDRDRPLKSSDGGGDLWIIVGLGNPGKAFAGNRHNASPTLSALAASHPRYLPFRTRQGDRGLVL
jgi:hypothetical protein